MSGSKPKEMVPLALLDPVLYGAASALSYLGLRGQVMLDKVGEGFLDYCFKEGYLQRSNDFQQLAGAVHSFFLENGYVGGMEIVQEGPVSTFTLRGWQFIGLMKKLRNQECYLLSCPLCVAVNSLMRANGIVEQVISENISRDGTYVVKAIFAPSSGLQQTTAEAPKLADMHKVQVQNKPSTEIGLPVFEAVEYGLARGFDYLGAQAQLLLDNVGRGIIEFLGDEYKAKLSAEYSKSMKELASFYMKHGLADKIDVDISTHEARMSLGNYRYAPVLRRLLDEGLRLASCPYTLAARAILKNDGYAVGEMQWELNGPNAILTLPLRRITHQEFDEEKIGSLMDAV